MATGKVKWFNGQKGYGFIEQEGGKDVFVHVNSLAPGVGSLSENQMVEFEVEQGQKGPQAVNVRPSRARRAPAVESTAGDPGLGAP